MRVCYAICVIVKHLLLFNWLHYYMANKGTTLTTESKYKISLAMGENRTKTLIKLKEYVGMLLDPEEKTLIPSIVSASLYAGMSKRALLAWEIVTAENSELRQILEFIRDYEEKWLRENGLLKLTDSNLTKALLASEHGLQEKPPQLTQNNIFNGLTPELLAEAMELSRTKKLKAK